MNLVEATVVEVLKEPHLVQPDGWNNQWWKVVFKYNCYGNVKTREDFFKTKEEASRFKVGYKFLT